MTNDPKPFLPYPKNTYWFWEIVNVLVPTIGILFFDWNIYSIVYLFWMEILIWGAIGALQILSALGVKGGILIHLINKAGNLFFFCLLYLGLFTILFAFTFVELDTSTILSVGGGIGTGLIILSVNYLIEYVRSEILAGRYLTRRPMEVIFERFMFALPLAALVLFAVVPLAKRFEEHHIEKVIAIGIIIAKTLMSFAAHYMPKIIFESETDATEENNDASIQ
jgi:hypothetical protein